MTMMRMRMRKKRPYLAVANSKADVPSVASVATSQPTSAVVAKDKRKLEAAATVVATTAKKVAPLATQATMPKSKGTAGTATNLAMIAPTAEVPRS